MQTETQRKHATSAVIVFFITLLLSYYAYFLPRMDYSCGDGSCMMDGMMYRYIAYALTVLGFYTVAVLSVRILIDQWWRCFALGAVLILLINPHGFFTILPH
ncbi:hypothetical protein [Chromobacterium haemolyticum]|uniref:hypothetical protein n=1 Tax=Chromobacterium haemolyticum TaxID=394935 RepID=UPI0013165026|nr:hypothetical protein [Chromobacterium haemolyticum]BBH13798.1 hypothetical protein CH06BL_30460 [Chromobacterium haemolyticum]